MSASSSNSLPIPPDWLLPLLQCPLCDDEIESNVARSGTQAGNRFYKCIRYDARQCRFLSSSMLTGGG
uniref:Zinc finger GRF-type domain-containing protein n=1 Tax=Triticum urartu TaxID=4572 RepID=A0A8R7VH92_TRIUA